MASDPYQRNGRRASTSRYGNTNPVVDDRTVNPGIYTSAQGGSGVMVTRSADRDRRRIYCTLLLHRTTYIIDEINGSMLRAGSIPGPPVPFGSCSAVRPGNISSLSQPHLSRVCPCGAAYHVQHLLDSYRVRRNLRSWTRYLSAYSPL